MKICGVCLSLWNLLVQCLRNLGRMTKMQVYILHFSDITSRLYYSISLYRFLTRRFQSDIRFLCTTVETHLHQSVSMKIPGICLSLWNLPVRKCAN